MLNNIDISLFDFIIENLNIVVFKKNEYLFNYFYECKHIREKNEFVRDSIIICRGGKLLFLDKVKTIIDYQTLEDTLLNFYEELSCEK